MEEIEKFKDAARQNEKEELQEFAESGAMSEEQGEDPPADSEICGRKSSQG
jgi:hypothetical protein